MGDLGDTFADQMKKREAGESEAKAPSSAAAAGTSDSWARRIKKLLGYGDKPADEPGKSES